MGDEAGRRGGATATIRVHLIVAFPISDHFPTEKGSDKLIALALSLEKRGATPGLEMG